jgi:hypothetical protein
MPGSIIAWTSFNPFAGKRANALWGTQVADAIAIWPVFRSRAITDHVANAWALSATIRTQAERTLLINNLEAIKTASLITFPRKYHAASLTFKLTANLVPADLSLELIHVCE